MFSFTKKLVDSFEKNLPHLGSASPTDVDSYFKKTLSLNNKGYGLRVLKVVPKSIAQEKGLESWFDFIIKVNGHELPMVYDSGSLPSYSINEDGTLNYGSNSNTKHASAVDYQQLLLNITAEKTVTFDVWSAKGGVLRQVVLPLKDYVAESVDDESVDDKTDASAATEKLFKDKFHQLGLVVQSQHVNTSTYVWRVLSSHPGSPAFKAQLVPLSDYIIGCDSMYTDDALSKGLLSEGGQSLLTRSIQTYYNHYHALTNEEEIPITVYAYNHDYDIVRPLTVRLSANWSTGGNRGILGCDVGYGLLHRIPEVVGKFEGQQIDDDIVFENNESADYDIHWNAKNGQSQYSLEDNLENLKETSGQKIDGDSIPTMAPTITPYYFPEETESSPYNPDSLDLPPRGPSVPGPGSPNNTPVSAAPISVPSPAPAPDDLTAAPAASSSFPRPSNDSQPPAPPPTFPNANPAVNPAATAFPAVPHRGRRKKHVAPSQNAIHDLVQSELAISKNSDVQYGSQASNGAPPPPPPKMK